MNLARPQTLKAGLAAVAAASALTLSGCFYINPQATEDQYSPADGVVEKIGDVTLNNLLIVAAGEDEPGRLLGTVVNSGDSEITVNVSTEKDDAEFTVPAQGKTELETIEDPVILDPAGAIPGRLTKVTIETAGESQTHDLPVLDHTYPRYADLIPGGAPSTPANPSNTPASQEHGEGGGGH